jgi:hypothetical protein
MKYLLFCFLFSVLFAQSSSDVKSGRLQLRDQTSCWLMSSSAEVGYRRDRQKLVFEDELVIRMSHLNSLQGTVSFFFDFDHVLLRFTGDYGWLLNGACHLKHLLFGSHFVNPIVGGYEADAQAILECRCRFWRSCSATASFIAGLGANYSHVNLMVGREASSFFPNGLLTLSYPQPFQQDWFGPLVEGKIECTVQHWHFNFFWQYIHVAFRQVASARLGVFIYDSMGSLADGEAITTRIVAKNNSLRTQLGGADLFYRSPNHWEIGTHFEGSSTWTRLTKSRFLQKFQPLSHQGSTTSEQRPSRLAQFWTSYRASLYGSYWF